MTRKDEKSTRTRRAFLTLLGLAPIAALAVPFAPLSNLEKLRARLEVMRANGLVNMHISWGPKAAQMSAEERAGHVLEWLDAPRVVSDRPPVSRRAPMDVNVTYAM
jgi:hypothetical protein